MCGAFDCLCEEGLANDVWGDRRAINAWKRRGGTCSCESVCDGINELVVLRGVVRECFLNLIAFKPSIEICDTFVSLGCWTKLGDSEGNVPVNGGGYCILGVAE